MKIPFTKVTEKPHPDIPETNEFFRKSKQCLIICHDCFEKNIYGTARYFSDDLKNEGWLIDPQHHGMSNVMAWYELPDVDEELK